MSGEEKKTDMKCEQHYNVGMDLYFFKNRGNENIEEMISHWSSFIRMIEHSSAVRITQYEDFHVYFNACKEYVLQIGSGMNVEDAIRLFANYVRKREVLNLREEGEDNDNSKNYRLINE